MHCRTEVLSKESEPLIDEIVRTLRKITQDLSTSDWIQTTKLAGHSQCLRLDLCAGETNGGALQLPNQIWELCCSGRPELAAEPCSYRIKFGCCGVPVSRKPTCLQDDETRSAAASTHRSGAYNGKLNAFRRTHAAFLRYSGETKFQFGPKVLKATLSDLSPPVYSFTC